MKIVYLITILLLFFSCKRKNHYVVEDRLCQCIIEEFSSRDINFDFEFNKLEKKLIKENILGSSVPKDYVKLNKLVELRTDESLSKIRFNTSKFNKLATFFQNRIPKDVCLAGVDSITVQQSRFYTVLMTVNKEGASLELNVLDFEHKYYRVKLLLALLMLNLMFNLS